MYALNLPHSPENKGIWERADPVEGGAGETEMTLETSYRRHPGVSDSIELSNDNGVTRQAPEISKRFLANRSGENGKPCMTLQCKRSLVKRRRCGGWKPV